jgi:phosphatidate cytidylyltransferase
MLRTRIISAIIAIPIVVAGVYFGGWPFFVGVLIVALIAGWEFVQMMGAGGYHPASIITLPLIALLIFDSFYTAVQPLLVAIITVALLFSLVWQLFQKSQTPTADWALSLAGGLYIGWGMGHLVALRELPDGLYLIFLVLFCTWASDIFAYFTGRAIGKHKLWPRHSPKKTWEGLFGGIAGSLVIAALFALFDPITWRVALLAGFIIPIAGLFGDLSISLMKRDVGIKDSSNLFPGHGGFLDRIDSILFVSITVYAMVSWIG